MGCIRLLGWHSCAHHWGSLWQASKCRLAVDREHVAAVQAGAAEEGLSVRRSHTSSKCVKVERQELSSKRGEMTLHI